MTIASLARPRSASPIGTGSPGAPSVGSTTNFGLSKPFCIGGVPGFIESGAVSSMGSAVGCCQVSTKKKYDGMAMTAAMVPATMQPIKTLVMRPDLPSACASARPTSCPANGSAGADELVDTLVLPPASLPSTPSPALDICASQAACTRESGSPGSVRALTFGGRSPHRTIHFSLECQFLSCTSPYDDMAPVSYRSSGRSERLMRVTTGSQAFFSLCGYTKSKQCMVEWRAEKLHRL
jgi:hypothetical protein